MKSKKYVWIESGEPIEVADTCKGTHDFLYERYRCEDCLGETYSTEECIANLLEKGKIKEVTSYMTLIEALQKYKKVTNDEGKSVYSLNKNGAIVMRTNGAGGGFQPTIELFTSTGWEEYKEPFILLERAIGKDYYYIANEEDISCYRDDECWTDNQNFRLYNYFENEDLAQYVADKQFIQRVSITLEYLNKDNSDKDTLIEEYIRNNHKKIIDRIKKYEEDNIK